MIMIRSLVIVTALCWWGTAANALTMHECRAKYKAAQTKSGVGLTWIRFQEKKCGIHAKATAPTPQPGAPESAEVRPPQLAASFNCHCAGAPPPITAPPLRFRARLNLVPASKATSQRGFVA